VTVGNLIAPSRPGSVLDFPKDMKNQDPAVLFSVTEPSFEFAAPAFFVMAKAAAL